MYNRSFDRHNVKLFRFLFVQRRKLISFGSRKQRRHESESSSYLAVPGTGTGQVGTFPFDLRVHSLVFIVFIHSEEVQDLILRHFCHHLRVPSYFSPV